MCKFLFVLFGVADTTIHLFNIATANQISEALRPEAGDYPIADKWLMTPKTLA